MAARAASDRERPLSELVGQLRETHRHRLDLLDAGDAVTNVRAVFSWSGRHLTRSAARMFRLLGAAHPGPDISVAAAASLAGLPPEQASRALDELTRARLQAEQPAGRFSFHDLLRAYAAEQSDIADTDSERRLAMRRVLSYYLRTAYHANRLLSPTREPLTLTEPAQAAAPEDLADEAQALAWLDAEYQVLLAAQANALNTIGWNSAMLGEYQRALTFCQKALDLLGHPDADIIRGKIFAHSSGPARSS